MTQYPHNHVKTALLLAFALAIVITALPAKEKSTERVPVAVSLPVADTTPVPTTNPEPPPPTPVWQTIDITPGDSLATLFKRNGLSAADLQAIVDIGSEVAILRRIMPGKTLAFVVDDSGELQRLRYSPGPLESLLVLREGEHFSAQRIVVESEYLTAYTTAQIDEESPSLYLAGKRAGLSDNIIMELSYIFQWDISFALDMRLGDTFAVLYEEVYVEGEKVKDGTILAAAFVNMGQTHTAVRYRDQNDRVDYFTPDGLSMRKAFIRDPVHFSHVSSRFNLRRLHPIHKRVMPHRGIDYAASRGTPVVASGDGKVKALSQNNASGKYVVIQHGQQYTTKYLHLSRFGKGVRTGSTVRQGQTIGYVGATGWATAPHLHYEFLVNGVHRNPRTVKLPKANPIAASDMSHFRKNTSGILTQLAAVRGTTGYASADTADRGASE